MYYKKLDEKYGFKQHDKWKEVVKHYGYEYITEAVETLYLDGESLRDIEKRFGMSLWTVRNILRLCGTPVRKRGGDQGVYKTSGDTDDEAPQMSFDDIGVVMGMTGEGVRRIYKQAIKNFKENWVSMYGAFDIEPNDGELFSKLLSSLQKAV